VTVSKLSGHFLKGEKGPVFIVLREPVKGASGCVLVVPPFAEEMNKSRRMVTEVGLGLAAMGMATVVPDLFGTGDSGGNFSDGDWTTWQRDLALASRWSAERGMPISGILAIRLGCALAASLVSAGAVGQVANTVLWQPVFDGQRFLGQFLRLRIAAALMDNDRKESQAELRGRLRNGEVIEVAGYGLSGQLASDLEMVSPPARLPGQFGSVTWMEVVREQGAEPTAAAIRLTEQTRTAGGAVELQQFPGEPFWGSNEIVHIGAMVQSTVLSFSRAGPSPGGGRSQ